MKKLILFVALIVGGVYFYGTRLPREHEVRSAVVITAPVDTVFKVVRSIGSSPSWWSDVKSVRPLTGRRRESWEQNMGGGAGLVSIEVTSVSPGQGMVTTIIPNEEEGEEDQQWGGTWSYRVFTSASGTQVEITEKGWVESPFFRVVMKLRGNYRTIDSYLASLGAHFGEMVTPRHAP